MKREEPRQGSEQHVAFQCGLRSESWIGSAPQFQRENDYDPSDDSCGYCGSLNPATFMERIERGDVLLGATDKNYKVYLRNDGGAPFRQSFRDCPRDLDCEGPGECTHWVTRETDHAKFYFQHLDKEQKLRFLELSNQQKLRFEGGIGFYVLPFFMCAATN